MAKTIVQNKDAGKPLIVASCRFKLLTCARKDAGQKNCAPGGSVSCTYKQLHRLFNTPLGSASRLIPPWQLLQLLLITAPKAHIASQLAAKETSQVISLPLAPHLTPYFFFFSIYILARAIHPEASTCHCLSQLSANSCRLQQRVLSSGGLYPAFLAKAGSHVRG